MFELYLIISDPALRTAIAEQIKLAPLANAELHEHDSIPTSFFNDPSALIIDAPLAEKKSLKAMHGVHGNHLKIFVLGEVEIEDDVLTDSFPKTFSLAHLIARFQFHLQSAHVPGETI